MCQIENLPRWKLARWWWRWVVWLSGKRCTILHKLWNINISDILKGATLALNSCQPASFPCPGCPLGAVGQDQRGRGEIQPTFFFKRQKTFVEHRLILQARLEQENTNPITFEWLVRIYFMKSSSPKSFFPARCETIYWTVRPSCPPMIDAGLASSATSESILSSMTKRKTFHFPCSCRDRDNNLMWKSVIGGYKRVPGQSNWKLETKCLTSS